MRNSIIKRLEAIFSKSCSGQHEETNDGGGGVITCTSQKPIEPFQSEVIPDTLRARHDQLQPVMQSDMADMKDPKKTALSIDSLAASIYFWSPYTPLGQEERAFKFMQERSRARTCDLNNEKEGNSKRRNKDAFINFSHAALVMVASNPETPTSTLKWLGAHHSAEVRKAVARNANTDDTTLSLLASNRDDSVKDAVLDSPGINPEIAAHLANDKSFYIASKARNIYYQLIMKPKAPIPLTLQPENSDKILDNEREFLKVVAESPDPSRRMFVQTPRQADWHIRMLVAGNPTATAEILWQLAASPVSQIKKRLVDKYNCLLETVVNLKGTKSIRSNNGLAGSTTKTLH